MRSSLKAPVLALILPIAATAQPSQDECEARLVRAHSQYEEQQFAEVERLVVECADRLAFPASQMDDGFRLLTLAYLRENLLAEAQSTVIKHLAWSFSYEPDDVRDPPLYVALFRVIKAQLTVPPAALIASSRPTAAPAQPPPPEPASTHTILEDVPEETGPPAAGQQTAPDETVAAISDPVETGPALDPSQSDSPPQAVTEPEPAPTQPSEERASRSEPPDESVATADPPVQVAADPPVQIAAATPEVTSGGPQPGVGLTDARGVADPARYAGGLSSVPGTTPPRELLTPTEYVSGEPLDFATVMPEIVGGQAAIRLQYPAYERLAGIEGRVVIKFVVGADGKVSDVEVLRSAGAGLDQAAMEAFERLEFTPGRQNGQPVPVRTTLTFHFSTGGDA